MLSDGWHTVYGYRVYVQDGLIKRGMVGSGVNQRPTYLYRWNPRLKVWLSTIAMTPESFRAGLKRGTVKMV